MKKGTIPWFTRIRKSKGLQKSLKTVDLCTYQCKADEGGGRGRAWGGDLIVFVGPGVGHLTDLVLPGGGYLNLSSPDVDIFDCRLGRKRLLPSICFSLPRFTYAPCGLKRSGSHGAHWEQAKAEWISLFCLQISFLWACFWSIEPSRFLQVQLISVWLIRYNQCNLTKLTFFFTLY